MSHQSKLPGFHHSAMSACALAMFTTILAATPVWAASHASEKTGSKSMPAMDQSKMGAMKDMGSMKMDGMSATGDTDYDFAANMRMHHQMAVDMSEAQIKNGKDPQMARMAKSIIAAQKKEISAFDKWMEAHKKAMPMAMPKSK